MPMGGKLIVETRDFDVRDELLAQDLQDKRGPYGQRAISDTGIGMDNATLAKQAIAIPPPGVLLVDMNLSDENGEDVLRKIREAGCRVSAIMVTGDAGSVVLETLRPLGAVGVVEKSHDTRPLIQKIEQITSTNSGRNGFAG